MTITGNLALADPAGFPQWQADDAVILRSRVIRPGTPQARLSAFADAVWILQPAHPDAHHGVNNLHWAKFPGALAATFKTFALAALDHPWPPVLALERRSRLMAVDTVASTVRDLRVFAQWMTDHGLERLPEVTGGRWTPTAVMSWPWPHPRRASPRCSTPSGCCGATAT